MSSADFEKGGRWYEELCDEFAHDLCKFLRITPSFLPTHASLVPTHAMLSGLVPFPFLDSCLLLLPTHASFFRLSPVFPGLTLLLRLDSGPNTCRQLARATQSEKSQGIDVHGCIMICACPACAGKGQASEATRAFCIFAVWKKVGLLQGHVFNCHTLAVPVTSSPRPERLCPALLHRRCKGLRSCTHQI